MWAEDVNIFISHVNAHQTMTSAEEHVNNQVHKITHSVDSGQLSSSVTPVIAQWAHEQVAMVAGMQVMNGLSNIGETPTHQG